MDKFEELVSKAEEQLGLKDHHSSEKAMLRGIGYALLALATAINGKKT